MNTDLVMQIVRNLLLGAGAYLAGRGLIPADQVAGVADQLMNLIPLIIAVGSPLWGIVVKWRTKTVPEAVGARANVPTVSPVTGAVQK